MVDRSLARNVALACLVLLVGLSAAAYGSVEHHAAEWLFFGALLCCAPLVFADSPRTILRGPASAFLLPLVLFAGWSWVQSAPLSRSIVERVSPEAARLYDDTVPPDGGATLPAWLLARAERNGVKVGEDRETPAAIPDRGDPSLGRSLSLHPGATRHASLLWLSPLLVIAASAWVSQRPICRYVLLWALAGWAAVWGVVAILQESGWTGHPVWSRDLAPEQMARLARPFVNPNHYAASVAMGALVALGVGLALLARGSGRLDWSGIRTSLLDREWTLPRVIAAGMLAAPAVAGVLLSRSRGGILAFACGVGFLVAARWLRRWLCVAVIAVVLVGLLAGVPSIAPKDRSTFATASFISPSADPSTLMRMDAWGKTLRMFLDYPVTGTGLGTFEWAFSGYQRQGESLAFREAHNDYVQVLAETGLIGLALLVWALGAFLLRVLLPVLRGVDGEPRWTSIGVAAAFFALMVHSVVDFNLQIPANAAQFAVLLGVLAAAAQDDAPAPEREDAP